MNKENLKKIIRALIIEEIKHINLDKSKITDIEFDGIDYKDAPEFVNAYISSARYEPEDRDLTDDELDWLNDDHDFVHGALTNHLYESKAKQQASKAKLDQTKDDKIDAGDAVVAARKAKIAQSKGDKKDAAYYEKIRKIVNKRIGQKAD